MLDIRDEHLSASKVRIRCCRAAVGQTVCNEIFALLEVPITREESPFVGEKMAVPAQLITTTVPWSKSDDLKHFKRSNSMDASSNKDWSVLYFTRRDSMAEATSGDLGSVDFVSREPIESTNTMLTWLENATLCCE